jgi:alpha-ribazole phosphatase
VSEIWLVRHAPVAPSGLCYGQSDVEVGVPADEAAARVHAALAFVPLTIVASPWARARTLAEALARRTGATLTIDARLAELSFGAWEGRAWDAIEREEPAALARWMADWTREAPPGGESCGELARRVGAWLDDARALAGPVLGVCHAGPIRAARVVSAGRSWPEAQREPVPFLVPEQVPRVAR